MNKDDLCKFCKMDNSVLAQPFNVGLYTYAPNMNIIIRVPRLDDVIIDYSDALKLRDNIQSMFANFSPAAHYDPLPVIKELSTEECEMCGGTGYLFKCPECNGKGKITVNTDFSKYVVDCKLCGGVGKFDPNSKPCNLCSGTGRIPIEDIVTINGKAYSHKYLHTLQSSATDIQFGTIISTIPHAPAHFVFKGGEGLIMEMLPVSEIYKNQSIQQNRKEQKYEN